MCGIAALLDPAAACSNGAAPAIAAALRHRGPDGEGQAQIGPALLVHTRLAIIDVAGGEQPLSSEDGARTAIVNGEIYNHRELRAELEQLGHEFATHSDSEVVVHGYEQWGTAVVERLNGIFAFALWDDREQRLVAARDPLGVKPLYWWSDGRRLAVASEVGALIAGGLVKPAVDRVALDHLLACRFVPSPRTLFDGVSKLPAASTLTAEPGASPRIESYRPPPGAAFDEASAAELADGLAERFEAAVERQMMSDVPYGAFLSGGIDSAAIVSAMARSGAGAPQTFTIGFPGHGDVLDERDAARETARALGSDHTDTAMRESDFLTELNAAVARLEEPCGIPSAPALMQLSRFAAEEVKVVLSGQGADEPLGGYGRHRAAAGLAAIARLPAFASPPARALADALPRNERAKRAARLLGPMSGTDRLLQLFEVADAGTRADLTGAPGEEAQAERRRLATGVLADVEQRPLLDQALYLDTHWFLPDGLLICGDKMSMAASLEQRVPFLDLELLRFVERAPGKVRVRRLQGKWLHKQAMSRLVPRAALERPKHGFSTPYDDWLRASLGEEVERRFSAGGELAELIAPDTVAGLVARHRSGRADHKWTLYSLLELSEWHRVFIESGEQSPLAPLSGS